MKNTSVICLRTLAEPLAENSLSHLSSNTRQELADNDLFGQRLPPLVPQCQHRGGSLF